LDPGDYDFDDLSFFLTKHVIGSTAPYVSGCATSQSILAIIAPAIPLNTVFVDADTELLFQTCSVLGSDDDVRVFLHEISAVSSPTTTVILISFLCHGL
jgi:hypothetical protein